MRHHQKKFQVRKLLKKKKKKKKKGKKYKNLSKEKVHFPFNISVLLMQLW